MGERAGQKTRPDGVQTNLDGVGVHHTVVLPSSRDEHSIGVRMMVDGPGDHPSVSMYAHPGVMDTGVVKLRVARTRRDPPPPTPTPTPTPPIGRNTATKP